MNAPLLFWLFVTLMCTAACLLNYLSTPSFLSCDTKDFNRKEFDDRRLFLICTTFAGALFSGTMALFVS